MDVSVNRRASLVHTQVNTHTHTHQMKNAHNSTPEHLTHSCQLKHKQTHRKRQRGWRGLWKRTGSTAILLWVEATSQVQLVSARPACCCCLTGSLDHDTVAVVTEQQQIVLDFCHWKKGWLMALSWDNTKRHFCQVSAYASVVSNLLV